MTLEVREVEIRDLNDETREFSGLAVPYGEVTQVGDYKETFLRDAFDDNAEAPLFFGHDHLNRGTPIGKLIASKNTDAGFEVTGRISKTPKGDEVYSLLRDGVLNKMSIGFEPVTHKTISGVVTRSKALLREVSIVPMAAYAGANIAEVRELTNEKENEMTETVIKTDSEVVELREAFSDLERKVAVLAEAGTQKNDGIQFRDSGAEFLKALAAGDESAQMEFRAFTGATTADSIAKAAWVARGLKLAEVNRKVYNLFTHKPLPASGNTIEYPQVASVSGSVAQQVLEGDDLTYSKVVLNTATAPVKTYGGYTSLSKQTIQRSDVAYLETALDHLARNYGRATNAAVSAALVAAAGKNAGTNFGLGASTAAGWLNFVLEGSAAIEDNGLGATAEFMLVSRDVFNKLALFADTTGRPMFVVDGPGVNSVGSANLVKAQGSIAGLPIVVDGSLAIRTAFVGASEAIEVYESAGAPYRLGDENIINLTEDFSLYGYSAIAVPNVKALFTVTLAV